MHVVLLSEKACVNNFVNYKCTCLSNGNIDCCHIVDQSICMHTKSSYIKMCITLYFVLTSAKSAFEECVC